MSKFNPAIFLIFVFFVTGVLASGDSELSPQEKRYEAGKAIFMGRLYAANIKKVCLANSAKATKVGLRSLNAESYEELASVLYDCGSPNELVSSKLNGRQLGDLMYFLNRRYRLGL